MKKLQLLLASLCLILAGACSSDDILDQTPGVPETPETPQQQGQRITIRATVNEAMAVKAGVVEGETNYTNGERFYWTNGNQIKLLFVPVNASGNEIFYSENPIPSSLLVAANADKATGTADFTGNIPDGLDGKYNVYACSPGIKQWSMSYSNGTTIDYLYAPYVFSALSQNQKQVGKSSEQLYADGNMELWGKAVTGVEIENGKLVGGTPELSYEMEQLNAMLRFTITNNTENKVMTVKKISVTAKKGNDNINTFFSHSARLDYSPIADGWNLLGAGVNSTMHLTVEEKGGEATIGKGETFDAYMCALPSGTILSADEAFIVEVLLEGADGKTYLRQGTITKTVPGFDFLFNNLGYGGLRAGTRYYFQIELKDENITMGYTIGDLYPSAANPIGVVCSTSDLGTRGTILSLDESLGTWLGNFQTGATDEFDGEYNTSEILSHGVISPATWCVSKGSGWYLPALNEMTTAFQNKAILNLALGGYIQLLPFPYWTSTVPNNPDSGGNYHEDLSYAYTVDDSGYTMRSRSTPCLVRAMKKFDIRPANP